MPGSNPDGSSYFHISKNLVIIIFHLKMIVVAGVITYMVLHVVLEEMVSINMLTIH